jgi:hypothetical protein
MWLERVSIAPTTPKVYQRTDNATLSTLVNHGVFHIPMPSLLSVGPDALQGLTIADLSGSRNHYYALSMSLVIDGQDKPV